MRKIISLTMALLLLLCFAGCGEEGQAETETVVATIEPAVTETPAPAHTAAPSATPEPAPTEEPEPPYQNPFNGAGMDEPYTARPFTVMFNNHTESLPHLGVSNADIVYEVLVEGGITRMMGVFSDIRFDDTLEAVRSIRPYYLDIATSYGAVICHAGGSEAAYSRISTERLNNIDGVRGSGYGVTVFARDQARRSAGVALEHTMYTTGNLLYQAAENKGYALTVDEGYDAGLRFTRDGTPENGEPAVKIKVSFGYKTTDLTYDPDSGMYTAVQYGGRNYVDGNSGKLVPFRNVIVFSAPTATLDGYGRLSITLNGSGAGWFACGGKYVPITWEREAGGLFRYYLEDGGELELGEGHTYIAIVPTSGGKADFTSA